MAREGRFLCSISFKIRWEESEICGAGRRLRAQWSHVISTIAVSDIINCRSIVLLLPLTVFVCVAAVVVFFFSSFIRSIYGCQ